MSVEDPFTTTRNKRRGFWGMIIVLAFFLIAVAGFIAAIGSAMRSH